MTKDLKTLRFLNVPAKLYSISKNIQKIARQCNQSDSHSITTSVFSYISDMCSLFVTQAADGNVLKNTGIINKDSTKD